MSTPNDDSESVRRRLERLEDLEAIRTLKGLYGRRGDAVFRTPSAASAAALADLFTDDGVLDLGPFGRYQGRAAIQAAAENVLPQATAWSAHYIVSPILELTGAEATGNWTFLIFAQPKGPSPAPVAPIWGAYQDRYCKTDAGWKIAESVASYAAPAQ
jgi:hypothetical protein